jgi:precorrin-3B synthase
MRGNAETIQQGSLSRMYAPPPPDSPIGYLPFPGRETGVFVAGVPRGRIAADALAGLADLADRFADRRLRLTPWRSVVLAGVPAAAERPLYAELDALDVITDPLYSRRRDPGPDISPTDANRPSPSKAAAP